MRSLQGAVLVAAAIFTIACGKPNPELYKIQMGMTEKEVIHKLGKPDSVSMKDNFKYLEYESFVYNQWTGVKENIQYFFVRINDGKVDLFGRKGDFNTTKTPERTVNVNENVRREDANKDQFDLAAELRKIEGLKKDGLISTHDYEQLRADAFKRVGLQPPSKNP